MSELIDADRLEASTRRDLDYLTLCGEEAERWLAEFCAPESTWIRREILRAHQHVRRHELARSAAILSAVERKLAAKDTEFHSIVRLLYRYHHSIKAYHHYVTGDLESAQADLLAARDEVLAVINLHAFLRPLALHCIDFTVQQARLARRENRWRDAKRHIEAVRDAYADRRPFCTLDSGAQVMLSDLRTFFAALPLNPEQRERVSILLGDDMPVDERIDRLEELIFALPDLVIPYP